MFCTSFHVYHSNIIKILAKDKTWPHFIIYVKAM